ncbi:MAG TPA: EamA family transporter [Actinomycetota bacterium]
MSPREERIALASFIAGSVLAGGNAVAVRFSNRELEPLWGAGLRFALAGLLGLGVMAAMRLAFPRGRALWWAMLYGTLNFAGSFSLAYYALLELHAGFGQTLLSLVPLATLLVAVAWRQERLRASGVVGSLVALAGVAVMSGASVQEVHLPSVLASVGAALCFAQAAVLVRWMPRVHPVTMNAVGMATGAVLLILGSLIAGEAIELPQRAATWWSIAYVVPIGSIVVFFLYLVVLRYWRASRAAYEFVIIPFFAVALSAWLDDEPIGWGLVLGGLLVLAGVYVGALRPGIERDESAPAEPEVSSDLR